jgi:hypothetical protein
MKNKSEADPAEPNARSRLLEAAIDMFAEKGYAGTSVREIVNHAGVELEGNVMDRLLMLYRRLYAGIDERRSLYKMIHGLIFGPPQGAPDYDFTRYHHHMIDAICKIYNAGIAGGEVKKIAAEDVAYLVLSLIDFCLHMDQVQPQSSDPQRPQRLLQMAFAGINKGTEN